MRYGMLLGVAAGALAVSQAGAQPRAGGARWTDIGADHEGDYSYDRASVERAGGAVRFRMRALLRPDSVGRMRSLVAQAEIDCAGQSVAYLSIESFDAAGVRLESVTPANARADSDGILPGSPLEQVYRRHCPRHLVRPIPEPPRLMTVAPPPLPPIVYTPPPPPPAPVPATPPPVRARLVTPIDSIVTAADYPPSAIRAGAQGTTRAVLRVAAEGRVIGCTVAQSSGSSVLDAATCRLLVQRARYAPAEDAQGRRTADVAAVAIVWGLPDEPPPTPAEPPQPPPEQS